MGSWSEGGLSRRMLGVAVATIVGCALAQSVAHIVVVLDEHRLDTFVDLDRSNGLPDILSTVALGCATAAALSLALVENGRRRAQLGGLAAVLGTLTLADLLHDGAHPSSTPGKVVVALVVGSAVLLWRAARSFSVRGRTILVVAAFSLAGSFLVTGLDSYDQWFERRRGDPVAEYQIVAKEGLELLGWSLVALALWDEALRRRRGRVTTARASRARAAPTRRAA